MYPIRVALRVLFGRMSWHLAGFSGWTACFCVTARNAKRRQRYEHETYYVVPGTCTERYYVVGLDHPLTARTCPVGCQMAGMQAVQERQQCPRTPASAAAAGCGGAAHAGRPASAGPTLRRRALDLRRLLHAMRTSTAPAAECESVQTQLLPSHVLADRLALSQSLLSHLHHAVAQSRQGRADHLHHLAVLAEGERRSADYDELERARREHLDQCGREDGLVQALAAEAEEVGRLVREDLLEARRREGAYGTSNGDDKGDALERDIIDELFLSPEEEDDDGGDTDVHDMHGDDYSLDLSDDGNDQQQQQQQQPQPAHGRPSPKQHHNHNTTTNGRITDEQQNEEVKRQQAEMLESEIAEMAAQMKSATLRMNTTLREQSSALDDMEQTVTENLDQVTDVTTKVTDHVSRGWRKTAATWTLLFTVVGTFAFLFMTMRVAPKRRDACIFFCSGDSRYETKWNQAEEERKRLLEELRLRDENDAVDAAAAATTAEQIAAEEKAARERKLEEERLRREEEAVAAEAQARADRIKEEENQKKADRERAERERERIAFENKAAQQEAATHGISEQDFRFAAGGRGHLEDVVSFIDRHPDKVNAPDANRWTALHEAARAGNTEIIQVLLGAGADVALTTKSGQNALQLLEGTHGPTHSAAFILRQGNLKSKEEEKNIARSEL